MSEGLGSIILLIFFIFTLNFPLFFSFHLIFLEDLLITTVYFHRKNDFEGYLTMIFVFTSSNPFLGREKFENCYLSAHKRVFLSPPVSTAFQCAVGAECAMTDSLAETQVTCEEYAL